MNTPPVSVFKSKVLIFKKSFFIFLVAAFLMSGFFAPQQAFAAATVTSASGGTNISIDTTSAGGTGAYKPLSGPGINELVAGDISAGVHTITLPAGWEFEISTISISTFGSDIVFESTSITPSPTSFSFNVTAQSTTGGFVGFGGLKVRPTGTTPSTSNMTYSGVGIVGVSGSTNFGTLSTVAGTVTKLAFTTEPGGAVYGSLLSPQPVVKTQDQFGNNSVNGLASNLNVTLSLTTGTGLLEGTNPIDIGTSAGNGTATFTDLTVDEVGTKGLTASATGPASDVSDTFEITAKSINVTAQTDSKIYNGTTDSSVAPVVDDLEFGDSVGTPPTQSYNTEDVGTGKTLTPSGLIIDDGVGGANYNVIYVNDTTGVINAKGLTVAGAVSVPKIYNGEINDAEVNFSSASLVGVVSGEEALVVLDQSGYSATYNDKNVGTVKTVTVLGLTLSGAGAGNYSLTQPVLTDGIITERTLAVTADGTTKVYDSTLDATDIVTLSDNRIPLDGLTLTHTAVFTDSKDVGVGKPVSVTDIAITGGDDAGNYILGNTMTATTADITPAQLTVSFTTAANKTYNGNNVAQITGRSVDSGIVGGEDVAVTGGSGSATFADKHVGIGLTVTATGFTLTGADFGNYEIGTINTTTGNVNPRPITVTAVTDGKTYDGTTDSDETPEITSSFSPPVALVDTANFIQTFDTKHFGTEKVLTPSGSVDDGNGGNNYTVTIVTVSTGEITKKSINVTAQPDTKVYDGATSSDVVPVVDPLETLDTVATPPTQSYDTKDEGTDKTLTPSGLLINDGNGGNNYTIVPVTDTTGVIEAKELTVVGAVSEPKTYDGDEDAEVDFSSATLDGVVLGEEALVSLDSTGYSATYNDKNVGTGKQVTVLGLTLDGAGASNYSLTQPVLNDGVITERTLVVTANGTTKVYDSTLDATNIVTLSDDRVPNDVLTLTHSAVFQTKGVGAAKAVNVTGISITGGTDAGNYTLNGVTTAGATANITPATLTATITAGNKVYDGTNAATITGRTPGGVLGTDEITLSGGTATFNNENVANGKLVSATGIIHGGADAGNYTYNGTATGNANITPLGITGSFTADNKVYDGNTTATVLTRSLSGVLLQDVANVTLTGGTATFASPNVADGIVVTASGMTLSGSAAGNYSLTIVATTMANITKAPLTITADAKTKVYGTANPELTVSYSGFVGGDTSAVVSGLLITTTATNLTPVGTPAITPSGATAANYNISFVPGILTITPAPLTITADAKSKTYGNDDPELTSVITSGSLINEDILTGLLSRVAGVNVGTYAITSTLANSNYTVTFVPANLTINKRPLTVTAVTATKTYDGNPTSAAIPTITSGSLVFGNTAGFTQAYNNENAGTDKSLTPSGVMIDGNSGLNYSYTFTPVSTGVINPLAITVTPTGGQTKVYGQTDPTFVYTFAPALIDGGFTGALSRATGENVGTYAYTLGTLSAGGNYALALTSTPSTFAITKAMPVITWGNPANIVYGTALSGTQLNATANIGGAFVYTPALGTILNAGIGQTLSATFTPTDTVNYNNIGSTVLITVTPKPLTVTAENKFKGVGTVDPALTYTFSGLVNNDTNAVFTGVLVRGVGELVGIYPINQGTLLAGNNYNIDYISGTLTIKNAPTVVSHTPSFDALNISPTTPIVVTFSEPVNVEIVDVSFSPTISVGFTITNSGTSVVTITPINPLANNTTYTITLNGVEDINGISLPTYSNIKFTTATTYSINLNSNASGWNLISLPVIPSNTAIATVLGSTISNINAVWTYDPANPNAVNGWFVFVPSNPGGTNNLTMMTAGFGYWVSVTSNSNLSGSGTLLIAGPNSPPSRSLQTGWNLVGYYQLPGEAGSTPAKAFVSIGASGVGYNGLWGFNNITGIFTSVTAINPGDGFWISLPSAKIYTPSNIY